MRYLILLLLFSFVGFSQVPQVTGHIYQELTTTQLNSLPTAYKVDGSIYYDTTKEDFVKWNETLGDWEYLGVTNMDWSEPVDSNILPETTETYNIGASGNVFSRIYSNEFYGSLFGFADLTGLDTEYSSHAGQSSDLNPASYNPNSGVLFFNNTDDRLRIVFDNQLKTIAFTDEISSAGTDDQNASEVPITDTENHFTATDVEGALAETSKVKDVTITSVTPSVTDTNKGGIVYLKNSSPISIDEPIGTFVDGDYITYVQDSTGVLEFNFKDIAKNVYKKTTEEGAVVFTHYTGTGWRFNCGLCEDTTVELIKTYGPDTYWDMTRALEADGIAVPSYSDYGANSNTLIAANTGTVNVAADGTKELDLDGVDDNYNASAPTSLNFLPTDTFWIIFQLGENLGGSDQFILHKGGTASSITSVQYGIYQSGSAIEANVGGVVTSQGAPATAEDIYVIQSDGTETELYINGTLADTITNGAYTNTGADVTVGARSGGTSKFFSGSIRRIAMKKDATLTSQQITDLNAAYNP